MASSYRSPSRPATAAETCSSAVARMEVSKASRSCCLATAPDENSWTGTCQAETMRRSLSRSSASSTANSSARRAPSEPSMPTTITGAYRPNNRASARRSVQPPAAAGWRVWSIARVRWVSSERNEATLRAYPRASRTKSVAGVCHTDSSHDASAGPAIPRRDSPQGDQRARGPGDRVVSAAQPTRASRAGGAPAQPVCNVAAHALTASGGPSCAG